MDYREQVAHHEAAHAVVALTTRLGLSSHGMDIDATTSVPGAFGQTGVMSYSPDLTQTEADQRQDLARLLAVTLAGAACDARIKSISPKDALAAQPGDLAVARAHCADYPFSQGKDEDGALQFGLHMADFNLAKPGAWDAVCAVAAACLAAGGSLSKTEIEDIALPLLGMTGPIGLQLT